MNEDEINRHNALRFRYENKIKSLVATYGWKALPKKESDEVRAFYWDMVAELGFDYPDESIITNNHTEIASSFRRVVVGDYGAYIEFSEDQVVGNIVCKKGQEGRLYGKGKYEHCKYYWLTIEDGSDVKIYLQTRTVAYADYIPGMYYVGIFECYSIPF